jgi:predicted amidophosphoribosyltransferase
MPTVSELSEAYANVMLSPRAGSDVCSDCFNLTDGHDRCFACTRSPRCLAAVVPISYSVAGEQLHHALAGYKRLPDPAGRQLALSLAAVLWRYLRAHEQCLASAAGVSRFSTVTSVPPTRSPDRLKEMLETQVAPVRGRYRSLLVANAPDVDAHHFSARRYRATQELEGQSVLLIDDTWTTGANAQSAAATLTQAGAGSVAALVIGRFINRRWHRNDMRLRSLSRPFCWDECALCAARNGAAA